MCFIRAAKKGITGFDANTVILSLCSYGYHLNEKIMGNQVFDLGYLTDVVDEYQKSHNFRVEFIYEENFDLAREKALNSVLRLTNFYDKCIDGIIKNSFLVKSHKINYFLTIASIDLGLLWLARAATAHFEIKGSDLKMVLFQKYLEYRENKPIDLKSAGVEINPVDVGSAAGIEIESIHPKPAGVKAKSVHLKSAGVKIKSIDLGGPEIKKRIENKRNERNPKIELIVKPILYNVIKEGLVEDFEFLQTTFCLIKEDVIGVCIEMGLFENIKTAAELLKDILGLYKGINPIHMDLILRNNLLGVMEHIDRVELRNYVQSKFGKKEINELENLYLIPAILFLGRKGSVIRNIPKNYSTFLEDIKMNNIDRISDNYKKFQGYFENDTIFTSLLDNERIEILRFITPKMSSSPVRINKRFGINISERICNNNFYWTTTLPLRINLSTKYLLDLISSRNPLNIVFYEMGDDTFHKYNVGLITKMKEKCEWGLLMTLRDTLCDTKDLDDYILEYKDVGQCYIDFICANKSIASLLTLCGTPISSEIKTYRKAYFIKNVFELEFFPSKNIMPSTEGIRGAYKNNKIETVKLLLGELSGYSGDEIDEAAENGHLEIMKIGITHPQNPQLPSINAFRNAAINGHIEIIQYLFLETEELYTFDYETIKMVFSKGHEIIIDLLIQGKIEGFGYRITGAEADCLCRYGYVDRLRELIFNFGIYPTEKGLRDACVNNQHEIVKILLYVEKDEHIIREVEAKYREIMEKELEKIELNAKYREIIEKELEEIESEKIELDKKEGMKEVLEKMKLDKNESENKKKRIEKEYTDNVQRKTNEMIAKTTWRIALISECLKLSHVSEIHWKL
jgi:hypothetical protein